MTKVLEYTLLYAGCFHKAGNVPVHTHLGRELIYTNMGHCIVEVSDRLFDCTPGVVLSIPPGHPHNHISLTESETFFCSFLTEKSAAGEEVPFLLDTEFDPWTKRWFQELVELITDSLADFGSELLTLLNRRLDFIANARCDISRIPLNIREAMRYIESDFAAIREVADIARHVGLSVSRLKASFKEHAGITPIKYLHEIRMKRAEQMLHIPYLSIAEIADACGYEDACYFGRRFRERNSMTPGEFRKRKSI